MAPSTAPSMPSTMCASQFTSAKHGLENGLVFTSSAAVPAHDPKTLGQDKLLIKVYTAALNPVDYKIAEMPLVERLVFKKPASPGLDFAGEIVALGVNAGVGGGEDDLKIGQMVFGRLDGPAQHGSLAEYTIAKRTGVAVLPAGVDPQHAACLATAGLTAYQSIVPNVKRGSGQRVFINGGSGGTGSLGIQIARAVGCRVVTSCSGRNADLCKQLGAEEVIDYTTADVVGALKSSAETGGAFDLILDNVGNRGDLFWQCHRFTSPTAKYVQVGAQISAYTAAELVMKYLWPGFLGGGKRKFGVLSVSSDPQQLEEIGQWMKEGKVKAVVDEAFALEDARQAFAKLKTGRVKGKIVVEIGSSR